ncbi:MAG: hypothetical protein EBU08_13560 [Micrococcales bacterium]|nr:hypothetical protein [Microbacteriaceae bacterium]NBR24770.1 hypothetical protein [Micrococcales bacterium]NBX94214.1 hypothetical protein [Actinomycetota bacterium]NBR77492.1 hypothetical protein [Microbacteriaceae bacterium]NBS61346.1 hypothetical protein [Microbacteriaceae bacterium]
MENLKLTPELVGGVIALFAVIVSTVQLVQSKKATVLSNRAYVSVRYEISKREGKPDVVLLVFENHGRSIARNIRLDFGGKTGWQYMQKPEDLPFVGGTALHELLPGMTLKYFVGDLSSKSTLPALRDAEIRATLNYLDDLTGKEKTHEVALTLRHLKYALKPT